MRMPLRRHAYLPTWVWPIWFFIICSAFVYRWQHAPSKKTWFHATSVPPDVVQGRYPLADRIYLGRIDRISEWFSGTICKFSYFIQLQVEEQRSIYHWNIDKFIPETLYIFSNCCIDKSNWQLIEIKRRREGNVGVKYRYFYVRVGHCERKTLKAMSQ